MGAGSSTPVESVSRSARLKYLYLQTKDADEVSVGGPVQVSKVYQSIRVEHFAVRTTDGLSYPAGPSCPTKTSTCALSSVRVPDDGNPRQFPADPCNIDNARRVGRRSEAYRVGFACGAHEHAASPNVSACAARCLDRRPAYGPAGSFCASSSASSYAWTSSVESLPRTPTV